MPEIPDAFWPEPSWEFPPLLPNLFSAGISLDESKLLAVLGLDDRFFPVVQEVKELRFFNPASIESRLFLFPKKPATVGPVASDAILVVDTAMLVTLSFLPATRC
jgi:hypothetical protein